MAELSTMARPTPRLRSSTPVTAGNCHSGTEQLATAAAVAADKGLQAALNDPALTAEQQARILRDVCGDTLGTQVRNFIAVLASNKRLALLPEIYTLYAQY